jgi:hypothetical protein
MGRIAGCILTLVIVESQDGYSSALVDKLFGSDTKLTEEEPIIRWIDAATVTVESSTAIAAIIVKTTCENCLEYLPSKGLIVTKHKCPHCDEWALLDQYA